MLNEELEKDNKVFHKPKVIFLIIFILSFIISVLIIIKIESERSIIEKAKASRIVGNYVSSIESVINNNLSVNHSLSMLIHESEEGRIDKFDELGKQILSLYPNISNISLAPDGIVEDIIPLEENKEAIGHNLFKDKNRSTEAMYTKASGVLTVAGPFELIQGGYSIIGRLPIFISDENGNQNFWGFTGVAMEVDCILNEINIESLKELGYEYELWKSNPDTDIKEMISSSELSVVEAEEQKVKLPNGEWNFGISPIGGWINRQWRIISILVALITSTLTAMFFWMVVKLRISKFSLEKIAFLDALTGLPNRRLLLDRLNQAIGYSKMEGTLLVVCYMDVDKFKDINDSFGHKGGNQVLIEISNRYRSILRATDTISRIGGDEFAVLLSGLKDKEECTKIVERVQSITKEPVIFEEHSIMVSISMGITIFPYDNGSAETLLNNADTALYKAKEKNKGQYIYYES